MAMTPNRYNEFKLTKQHLVTLLSDTGFYRACIAYLFMEDSAVAALRVYKQLLAQGEHGDAVKVMAAPIDTFVRHTAALLRKDPAYLHPVGDYLCQQLGCRVERFTLAIADGDGLRLLVFEPSPEVACCG